MANSRPVVAAYVDPDEKEKMVLIASELRLSQSNVLRHMIRKYKLKNPPVVQEDAQ
jgi:hypothetical protein